MASLSAIIFTPQSDEARTVEAAGPAWIVEEGETISTLAGDDIIDGQIEFPFGSGIAIENNGIIITGSGSDTITGLSLTATIAAFVNNGMLETGTGADFILVTGQMSGLDNYGQISLGTDSDGLIGSGDLFGLRNYGSIETGSGNDDVSGAGVTNGIINEGIIRTGSGRDLVQSVGGFFGGSGTTDLGDGNDTLRGFGTGTFRGAGGTDTIVLRVEGEYEIISGIITSGGIAMSVSSFERIAGSGGGNFAYANGIVTVDSEGVATFA